MPHRRSVGPTGRECDGTGRPTGKDAWTMGHRWPGAERCPGGGTACLWQHGAVSGLGLLSWPHLMYLHLRGTRLDEPLHCTELSQSLFRAVRHFCCCCRPNLIMSFTPGRFVSVPCTFISTSSQLSYLFFKMNLKIIFSNSKTGRRLI